MSSVNSDLKLCHKRANLAGHVFIIPTSKRSSPTLSCPAGRSQRGGKVTQKPRKYTFRNAAGKFDGF